jgi:hypothetical protein
VGLGFHHQQPAHTGADGDADARGVAVIDRQAGIGDRLPVSTVVSLSNGALLDLTGINFQTLAGLEANDSSGTRVELGAADLARFFLEHIDESLADYAHFVKNNQRYSQALTQAQSPQGYVQGLQNAGYATDTQYAKKIMDIHESQHFKT